MTELHALSSDTSGRVSPAARFMAVALLRHAGIGPELQGAFTRAVERLTSAIALGHIRIDIDGEERAAIAASEVAGDESHAPLVLSGNALYFGRYFRYELELADALRAMSANGRAESREPDPVQSDIGVIDSPGNSPDIHQDHAAAIALDRRLCVISGGPGTGKTTLIVQILSRLIGRYGPDFRIGLAAPTGKAAMRMNESIRAQLDRMKPPETLTAAFPDEAVTIHRLLGLGRFGSDPRYDRDNPLPFDVVVIDEASMVDLALMWRLVSGLSPHARLILIGDKDQLASVESGAVLADCIESLSDSVAQLKTTYRFNESIGALAADIRDGNPEAVWARVCDPAVDDVSTAGPGWLGAIAAEYERFIRDVRKVEGSENYPRLFALFGRHMVLSALRRGMYGVEEINHRVERSLAERGLISPGAQWYAGKPVMITANDHRLSLFNGDIGICLPDPDSGGELRVWFDRGGGRLQKYPPGRIPPSQTAWAMTIHKSQGSEFEHVTVVLPDKDNQILCRELLYTAVTRARKRLTLVITEEICTTCVSRRTVRHSGLAERLQTPENRAEE